MLEWLESLSLATWVRESPSVWAMPAALTLHTTGMAVLVGACWVLDLRLLGIGRAIPLSAFRWVFSVVAVGLVVNITTGILLFAQNATTWGTSIPFLVKMILVVASAATLMPLRSLVMQSDGKQGEVGANARWLAIVSILAWAGAVTAGRLLAYVMP
jgi:hypothetical protein